MALVGYTYFLYPFSMYLVSFNKKDNTVLFLKEELPNIAVVMAVYNEEAVIEKKLKKHFCFRLFIRKNCLLYRFRCIK